MAKRKKQHEPLILLTAEDRAFLAEFERSSQAYVDRVTKTKEFATEAANRDARLDSNPTVIGAVIDLGYCLDLTSSRGLKATKTAFTRLQQISNKVGLPLPQNQTDGLRNNLDCAVLNFLHSVQAEDGKQPFDTVKGVFIEKPPLYTGSAFGVKNHIQIAVRNPDCIKGVFRVPASHLDPNA